MDASQLSLGVREAGRKDEVDEMQARKLEKHGVDWALVSAFIKSQAGKKKLAMCSKKGMQLVAEGRGSFWRGNLSWNPAIAKDQPLNARAGQDPWLTNSDVAAAPTPELGQGTGECEANGIPRVSLSCRTRARLRNERQYEK